MKTSEKRKKMLLVLPVLVIPFLTMGFWALGGGSRNKGSAAIEKGLNLALPDANLKEDKLSDKMDFYDQSDNDSMKLEEMMRNDPYYEADTVPYELQEITSGTASKYNQRLNVSPYEVKANDPSDKILQKLKSLEKEMNMPVVNTGLLHSKEDDFSAEVNRLEEMMKVNNSSSSEDAEMDHLNSALEKILDVQHPQRVKHRLQEQSLLNKGFTYAVSKSSGTDTIVKGFFGLSDEKEIASATSIEAVVHENQTLVNGAVVKLRLVNAIYINGRLVPEGSFVYGLASLDGERLMVEINSIRSATNLFAVKLEVYDMDGLSGIHIPGSINRDVAKQSADNSLSLLELGAVDPSLKAQAASAGVGAVKGLLSKKVKLVKVMVKAGYKVLLKDKNIEQ